MKKYLILFTCFALAAFFTSCQKDLSIENFPLGPDSTLTDTSSRVKSYTEMTTSPTLDTTITFTLAYDNAGRLVSITSLTDPGFKFLYSFPAANKFTMDLYNSNIPDIHEDFYVNSNLFVDSTFQYNSTQDTATEKYFYDAGNNLVKTYEYQVTDGNPGLPEITTFSYNADGDMVTATSTTGEVTTVTYYTDLSYAAPFFSGFPNSQSAKKAHLKKTATSTTTGTVTFTYTFDSRNRISTETATAGDGSIVKKTYTY